MEPGCFSQALEWSRGKVRRFLKELEKSDHQIVQQKNNITTLINIINYEQYQGNGTADGTADGQQTDSRRYTNKNDKNDKKGKNMARGQKIPTEFTITPPMKSWLKKQDFKIKPEYETEKFIDHFQAKGEAKKDWVAAWRNWMRKANEYCKDDRSDWI
jgi:hypothetical protein